MAPSQGRRERSLRNAARDDDETTVAVLVQSAAIFDHDSLQVRYLNSGGDQEEVVVLRSAIVWDLKRSIALNRNLRAKQVRVMGAGRLILADEVAMSAFLVGTEPMPALSLDFLHEWSEPLLLRGTGSLLAPEFKLTEALRRCGASEPVPVAVLRHGQSLPSYQKVTVTLETFMDMTFPSERQPWYRTRTLEIAEFFRMVFGGQTLNLIETPCCRLKDTQKWYFLQRLHIQDYPRIAAQCKQLPRWPPLLVPFPRVVGPFLFAGAAGVHTSLQVDRGDYAPSMKTQLPNSCIVPTHPVGGVGNLFLQLEGRRHFILYPPADPETLVGGQHAAHISLVTHPESANVANWFPGFPESAAHHFELGPGDALLIPPLWWYMSETLEDGTAASWWFDATPASDHSAQPDCP